METGKFIVFEGIDGSGKSTQTNLVSEFLAQKFNTFKTAQPTKSTLGSLLRRYLSGELLADNLVLATLFASDRLDHLLSCDGILNRYNNGEIIICDRNYFSSFAYQDTGDDFVIDVNSKAREILKPDLHIFINVDIDIALSRINATRENLEIFETRENLLKIYNSYIKNFKRFENEENIVFIDGNKSQDEVFNDIILEINKIL